MSKSLPHSAAFILFVATLLLLHFVDFLGITPILSRIDLRVELLQRQAWSS